MKEFLKDVIVAVAVAIIVLQFIKPVIVKESSMENTFFDNDYMLVSKQSYRVHDVERGDVIVFKSDLLTDDGDQKLLIKRVIGLPGEEITIRDGQVYIDGEALTEGYLKDGVTDGDIDTVIPEGQYFCMGDNRLVSIDSRKPEVGPIEKHRIVGKVFLKLYPFDEIGLIETPEYNR